MPTQHEDPTAPKTTCPHCAYDLSSLDDSATACPECGKNITDAPLRRMTDPPAWYRRRRLGWRFNAYAMWALLAGFLAAFATTALSAPDEAASIIFAGIPGVALVIATALVATPAPSASLVVNPREVARAAVATIVTLAAVTAIALALAAETSGSRARFAAVGAPFIAADILLARHLADDFLRRVDQPKPRTAWTAAGILAPLAAALGGASIAEAAGIAPWPTTLASASLFFGLFGLFAWIPFRAALGHNTTRRA